MSKVFSIKQIGTIIRKNNKTYVSIFKEFHKGLQQLDQFSHAQIYWWADKNDTDEKRSILDMVPPYGEDPPRTGVFASRAEYRPNPLAMTVVKILSINDGMIEINNIDAFDETPVIDVKAYYAVTDRVDDSKLPSWIKGWPESYPNEGFGLY
ncbi:MAG: tRNA (N6-threonylcarbamoyladenosine(37)-N6)-methyltransferase TrmO [Candidatus Heimdallarchaeota archaeon]|nr:tRNA (N6-threonylcarbamoyladenosine(37)-N6)-methyltransferase TrmO [Candidatus Heimdallarchaeota archaeon]